MTITDQLEGLLPADGPITKPDRIIADAVAELRAADERGKNHRRIVHDAFERGLYVMAGKDRRDTIRNLALAFILGIAVAAGWVW